MAERSGGMNGLLGVVIGAAIVLAVMSFVTDGFGTNEEEVSIELQVPGLD